MDDRQRRGFTAMVAPPRAEITRLLQSWADGDRGALADVVRLIEAEIRRVARQALQRESPGKRLQTTELINETYLRLLKQRRVRWQNRSHFLGVAAQIMRRILVDLARQRRAAKRGDDAAEIPLDVVSVPIPGVSVDHVALDEALRGLTRLDPRQAQVIELRYFGGFSIRETADILNVAPATIARDTASGLAWLQRELTSSPG